MLPRAGAGGLLAPEPVSARAGLMLVPSPLEPEAPLVLAASVSADRSSGWKSRRVRQWLKSTVPDFDMKANRVRGLDENPLKGAMIGSVDKRLRQRL